MQWKYLLTCENSWETIDVLEKTLPLFPLEDEVKAIGASIDKRPLVKR